MAIWITMPKLSPTMTEGTIAKWHKAVGDKVSAGDLLVEIATDKATLEYNALDDGYLRTILLPVGGTALINAPIALCTETADAPLPELPKKGESPPKKAAPPTKSPEPLQQQPTTSPPPRARFTPEAPLEDYRFPFPEERVPHHIPASPLAKKLAKEKGLSLSSVKGSGPKGRITSHDLDLAQPNQRFSFGARTTPSIAPGTFEELPLTPMRKVIAERLQASKSFIPHIYLRQEIDAGPLVALREELKEANLKISVNDFIIRATALALKEHPAINSGFHTEHQSILRFQTIDIAVAVSLEQGLITPILRHADYKNLGEISAEIRELGARAKLGKLDLHEYQGGSFTISNMGMYGISDFAAIINPPQSSILAVGAIEECVHVHQGTLLAGKKMTLVLSSDHRVVDGSDGAKFLKTLQQYLEHPSWLLL